MHEEYYKKNNPLGNLVKNDLLFFSLGFLIKEYTHYVNNSKSYCKKNFSKEINEKINTLKNKKIDIYSIILKPNGFDFKTYKNFLFNCISFYNFNLLELEEISIFLKERRKMEILFLSDTIEYNNGFKLIKDNGIDHKILMLQESYNLKEIYGYFNSSINSALYKLDTLSDNQRRFLKNKIYSNIFKSGNEKIFFEKNLPGNYRKSSLLKFIEENFELDCIWEDVPVNEFIKRFFKKLEQLEKIHTA